MESFIIHCQTEAFFCRLGAGCTKVVSCDDELSSMVTIIIGRLLGDVWVSCALLTAEAWVSVLDKAELVDLEVLSLHSLLLVLLLLPLEVLCSSLSLDESSTTMLVSRFVCLCSGSNAVATGEADFEVQM